MINSIKKYLTLFIFFIVMIFAISSINKNYAVALENNYTLDTNSVQKKFYKYGVFSIAGLSIKNGDSIIDSSKIEVISYPDLTTTGNQTVKVSYANQVFNYNIEVIDNHPGDVITLTDGSRWNFIQNKNNEITLLSEDYLKNDNSIPVFNDDETEVYKADFAGTKDILEQFTLKFLNGLGIKNDSSVSISLPDANKISKIAGIAGWEDGKMLDAVTIPNYTRIFLQSTRYETKDDKPYGIPYWTANEYTGTGGKPSCGNNKCHWAIQESKITRYVDNHQNVAIRPQLTLSSEQLKDIFIDKSNYLPFVTSANYYVYDVKNEKVLFNKKGETKYKKDDIDTIYPASLTKIATVIYSIKRMEEKGLDITNTVVIDSCIGDIKSGSMAGFETGDTVTYKDLLYGALFPSGRDATMQLSISLGDLDRNSHTCAELEADFAEDMTKYVKENIPKNISSKTNFVNASGIFNDGQVATMEDITKILEYALGYKIFKDIYTDKNYSTEITSSNGKTRTLSFDAPNSILKMFPYYLGTKNGNSSNGKTGANYIHTGYHSAAYLGYKDNSAVNSYIVITASDYAKISMIINQFNIYQWLYPGSITKISFNSNGGSMVNDIFQIYGTNIKLPTPIKMGYTFKGWYKDSNLNTKFEEDVMPNEDTILYAMWEEISSNDIFENIDYNYLEKKHIMQINEVNVNQNKYNAKVVLKSGYTMQVELKDNGKVYTGSKTRIYSDSQLLLTIVNSLKGDVSGDGDLSSMDYIKIRNHIMQVENKMISGDEYLDAADYNGDNKISSLDYVKMRNYLMS